MKLLIIRRKRKSLKYEEIWLERIVLENKLDSEVLGYKRLR